MGRWLAFALLAAVLLPAAAQRVTKPVVTIARLGQCVEATGLMRRDHMKLLMHQRDRTMREGIRAPRHSLAGCVDCHANARTGSVLGKDGFCQSCHSYTAVKLDCFECHSSKPEAAMVKTKP
jgi:hypothetical protein